QLVREAGAVEPREELSLLFRGLTALEAMVGAVREAGEAPPADPELVTALAGRPGSAALNKKRADAPAAAPRPSARPAARLDAPRPPPTVRVNTRTLDRFLSTVGEVILNTSQVRTVSQSGASQNTALAEGLDRMDRVVGELQRRALELRTTPLLRILEPLPRAARDVAERAGVRVEVQLRGAELELDRSILDRLSDPLVHLLRNAVDHGIEPPDARVAAG